MDHQDMHRIIHRDLARVFRCFCIVAVSHLIVPMEVEVMVVTMTMTLMMIVVVVIGTTLIMMWIMVWMMDMITATVMTKEQG